MCKEGSEDTRHCFLLCPFYATKRAVIKRSVNEILLKNNLNYPANFPLNELNLYLYGLSTISSSDNSLVIMATIKFIKESYRFSTYVLRPVPIHISQGLVYHYICLLYVCLVFSHFNFIRVFVVFILGMCGVMAHFLCHASLNVL